MITYNPRLRGRLPSGCSRRICAVFLPFVLWAQLSPAQVPPSTRGVDPRLTQAIAWYTGAAGRVDDERAHALLLAAVADDDPISLMWLARCHSRGRMRVERDAVKANELATRVGGEIARLAELGIAEAVFLMGTAYDEGLGVAKDPIQAERWYRRSAERGNVQAREALKRLGAG